MSWSIGYDHTWARDIGYGVPAVCDYPRCNTQIDRGLAYVCGGEPYGGEWGCGLYFCNAHLYYTQIPERPSQGVQACERCSHNISIGDQWRAYWPLFEAKPDIRTWSRWKLTHESWEVWRRHNPEDVALLLQRFPKLANHNKIST